jgi:hypothetical protein
MRAMVQVGRGAHTLLWSVLGAPIPLFSHICSYIEPKSPFDRALSWREMGAKRRRALGPSHTQTPHPWPRTLPGARCAVHRYGGRQPPPLHAMMAAKVDHEDPEWAQRT